MKKLLTIAMIGVSAIASTAYAQEESKSGIYVHLRAGLADPSNSDISIFSKKTDKAASTPLAKIEPDVKSAAAFGGEVGYKFGNIRLGGEVSYHRNKIKGARLVSAAGTTLTEAELSRLNRTFLVSTGTEAGAAKVKGQNIEGDLGHIRNIALMANATYDIPLDGPVKPYVGVGLGAVSVMPSNKVDVDFAFAWQARAGAAFKLTDTFALTADYTYRQSNEAKFPGKNEELILGRTKTSLFQVGVRADF